ncbi:hypothetical protein [Dyella sp. S184]|uniref:hypothetical protein n=1 Tax=Dyella sp. S184 TaxID=1641862 RepID=UPI00131E0308|nr:hypothetical protein [Dyella sp. S184]
MKTTLAFLAAILVPVGLITGWYLWEQFATFKPNDPYIWVRTGNFLCLCALISVAYVLVLGLPTYVLLRWRNAVRCWSTIASGFVLGAFPVAVLSWPLRFSGGASATIDGVPTLVNGIPTFAGWLQYLELVAFMGACGVASAAAFSLIARRPNSSSKRTPKPLRGFGTA